MTIDLSDDERTLLLNMLTLEIEVIKFPLSPRIESLKRIRAKLTGDGAPAPALAPRHKFAVSRVAQRDKACTCR